MPEATTFSAKSLQSKNMPSIRLPAISVDDMSSADLRSFIPQMIKKVTGRSHLNYGRPECRPEWWPNDVPWTNPKNDARVPSLRKRGSWCECLRVVVRRCYQHLGQEELLFAAEVPETARVAQLPNGETDLLSERDFAKARTKLFVDCPDSTLPTSNTVRNPGHGTINEDALNWCSRNDNDFQDVVEVYICFFCEMEFTDRETMRSHQLACDERPPQLQAVQTPPRLQHHKGPPQMSPSPSVVMHSHKPSKPSKETMIKYLGLVPARKAESIMASIRNSVDVDCEIICVEEPRSPILPNTPRTSHSLMSQLSQDESAGHRNRSTSMCAADNDNSDNESVVSVSSEETNEQKKNNSSNMSLLNIPVSSLLGQRVQKHIVVDAITKVRNAFDHYCKTPEKNEFLGKLRGRDRAAMYPVTFKRRRIMSNKYWHQFKFNSFQRVDFLERMRTGLSRRSRALLKLTKKCSVPLTRLTQPQIKRWVKPERKLTVVLETLTPEKILHSLSPQGKTLISSESQKPATFPSMPTLLSGNIDQMLGLRKKGVVVNLQSSRLAACNVVSEDTNAELSRQKLTLYRSLLSDCSSKSNQPASSSHVLSSPPSTSSITNRYIHLAKHLTSNADKHVNTVSPGLFWGKPKVLTSLLPKQIETSPEFPHNSASRLSANLSDRPTPFDSFLKNAQNRPVPQALFKNCSNTSNVSASSLLICYLNNETNRMSHQTLNISPQNKPTVSKLTRGQKRKQSFDDVRTDLCATDDDIDVVSVSSTDDEELTSETCSCTGCKKRESCRLQPTEASNVNSLSSPSISQYRLVIGGKNATQKSSVIRGNSATQNMLVFSGNSATQNSLLTTSTRVTQNKSVILDNGSTRTNFVICGNNVKQIGPIASSNSAKQNIPVSCNNIVIRSNPLVCVTRTPPQNNSTVVRSGANARQGNLVIRNTVTTQSRPDSTGNITLRNNSHMIGESDPKSRLPDGGIQLPIGCDHKSPIKGGTSYKLRSRAQLSPCSTISSASESEFSSQQKIIFSSERLGSGSLTPSDSDSSVSPFVPSIKRSITASPAQTYSLRSASPCKNVVLTRSQSESKLGQQPMTNSPRKKLKLICDKGKPVVEKKTVGKMESRTPDVENSGIRIVDDVIVID